MARYQRRTTANRIVDRAPMLFLEIVENRMQIRKMPAIMLMPLTALAGANWDSFSAVVPSPDSTFDLRDSIFSFTILLIARSVSAPIPPSCVLGYYMQPERFPSGRVNMLFSCILGRYALFGAYENSPPWFGESRNRMKIPLEGVSPGLDSNQQTRGMSPGCTPLHRLTEERAPSD